MGLNWRQAGQNMGAGMAQLGQQMVSAELQAQRDKNLARYKREEMTQGHAQQLELQGNQIDAQNFARHQDLIGGQQIASQKAQSEQMQAETERQQELEDAQRKQEWEQENIRLKAEVNPSKGVNVTTNVGKGESAYNKKFNEARASADVTMYETTRNEVKAANDMSRDLDIMEGIMDNADTGVTQEALAKLGQIVGTDASTAMQAFNASSSTLVLDLAGKLSGVISDRDMITIENAAPGFGKNPEANKIIIGKLREAIGRSRENYSSMNAHMKQHPDGLLKGWEMPNQQGGPTAIEQPSSEGFSLKTDFEKWKASK